MVGTKVGTNFILAKLTLNELKNLKPDDGKTTLPDGESVYGTVRHGKTGTSVSFIFKYKYQGKFKNVRVGTWPKDGLKEIRAEATAARNLLAEGKDPALERRNTKQGAKQEQQSKAAELEAMRAGITFSELAEKWITQDRATAMKDKGAEVRRSFNKDLIPDLGKLLVKDLTRGRIAIQLDKVKARSPSIARYLLADMRAMFKWAMIREYIDSDPTYLLELKKYATKNERERILSSEEIKELSTALPAALLPVHTEQALWIMLATCCRVGEISQAKWTDVDLDKGTWRIPAPNSKNGKPLTISLSAFAIESFKAIRAEQTRQMEAWERPTLPAYVIPNDNWTTHIDVKAIGKQVRDRQRETPLKGRSQKANKALVLKGEDAWTPHDLRRTGATLMRSLGIDSDTIEACLNHVKKDTLKRIYQRPDLSHEMAVAWATLGERLDLLKSNHANVVELTPRQIA